jgi:invasion protein IalB
MMRLFLAAAFAALTLPAVAQTVTLPGGASALTETHGDWTVRCQVQQQENRIGCIVQQEQIDTQSRQRLLAVELVRSAEGVRGSLVLPFGLDLEKGVSVAVDDAQPTATLRFRTCLPQGCIVPLAFANDAVAALSSGGVLNVSAVADSGEATPFKVSLTGFTSAVTRAQELAK